MLLRVLRGTLVVLTTFILPYQVVSSWDTIRVQRTFEFHVPFTLQPFTNIVVENEPFSGLRRGDALLAIDDRELRGNSSYLRALWQSRNQPVPPEQWRPFVLTARTAGIDRLVQIYFPHCTCGSMELWQAISVWLAPPLFCVVLGFWVVWRNAQSGLAWAYFATLLSMSQFDVEPAAYSGFQIEASPMLWTHTAARVFGVAYNALAQHWWPAAATIAIVCVLRDRPRIVWAASALAMVFAAFAVLHATLAIAWSEEYRPWVNWYLWVGQYETERMLLSFAAVSALGWALDKTFGLLLLGLTLAAAGVVFNAPAPITSGEWVYYANNTTLYELIVPPFHHTQELAMLLFVVGTIAAVVIRQNGLPLLGLALCAPMIFDAAARLGRYWYPLDPGFFEYWIWAVLALGAVGLSLVARWVAKQPAQNRSQTPSGFCCSTPGFDQSHTPAAKMARSRRLSASESATLYSPKSTGFKTHFSTLFVIGPPATMRGDGVAGYSLLHSPPSNVCVSIMRSPLAV